MKRALLLVLACGSSESAPPTPAPKPTPTKPGLVPAHPVDCTREGWCRVPGLDPDDLIHAVASEAPGKLWAVGAAGIVFRYDGKTLTHERIDSVDLESVAVDGDNVWALDHDHGVWHRHGSGGWKRVATGGPGTYDLWCESDEAWLFGSGKSLLRIAHDGTATSVATPATPFTVVAAAPGDLWFAGVSDDNTVVAYHGDGQTWHDTSLPAVKRPQSMTLVSAQRGDVSLVLDDDAVHWDGRSWASVARVAVATRTSTNRLDVTLGHGETVDKQLRIQVGDKVTPLRTKLPIADPDVWVGPDAVWLVGVHDAKAVVARWDGARFTNNEVLPDGSFNPAVVIAGDNEPWIAATGGDAWHRKAGAWVHETTGVDAGWITVRGDDVFVASRRQIAVRQHDKWSTSTVEHDITTLATGGGEVFVATDDGALLRWTGKAFERAGTTPRASTIVVRGAKLVDVTSDHGAWRWHGGDTADELTTAYVLSAGAVGDALYLMTFDAGRYNVTIVNPSTKSTVVEPVHEERLVVGGVRDGVVWLMQGGSGDLVFKRF